MMVIIIKVRLPDSDMFTVGKMFGCSFEKRFKKPEISFARKTSIKPEYSYFQSVYSIEKSVCMIIVV